MFGPRNANRRRDHKRGSDDDLPSGVATVHCGNKGAGCSVKFLKFLEIPCDGGAQWYLILRASSLRLGPHRRRLRCEVCSSIGGWDMRAHGPALPRRRCAGRRAADSLGAAAVWAAETLEGRTLLSAGLYFDAHAPSTGRELYK